MSIFTEKDFAILIMDGFSILLMIVVMLLSSEDRRRNREDDRCFFWILIVSCILSASDAVAYFFEKKTLPGSAFFGIFGMTILAICYVSISMIWVRYCRIRFKDRGAGNGSFIKPVYIPGALMLVVIMLNIFTGWLFSYNPDGTYRYEMPMLAAYVILVLYLGLGFSYLIGYRSHHTNRGIIAVPVYAMPVLVGIIIDFFTVGCASFTPMALAMCITFTYMGTINESLDNAYNMKEKK